MALSTEQWVDELYRALVGRAPDAAGREYWINAINAGLHTQPSSYQAMMGMAEVQNNLRNRIREAYVSTLGREADAGGVEYWLSQIASGKVGPDLSTIQTTLQKSPEGRTVQGRAPATGTPPAAPGGTLGGGTGGGVADGGTIPSQNLSAEVGLLLAHYGLEGLKDWALEMIKDPRVTDAELVLRLYQHDEFKKRFPAMDILREAGMPPITPEQYMDYERTAHGMMRAAGLPEGFYDQLSDFTDLIGSNVSPAELGARIQQGYQRVLQAPIEVRARYAQLFGANGDGALAAHFLDPDKALPILEQQVSTAEIAGFGDIFGIGIGQATAERLAAMGYDGRTASPGFQEINQRRALFNESITETTDLRAEVEGVDAAFGLNQDTADTIENRRLGRISALSGGGGLAIDQSGIAGRADS